MVAYVILWGVEGAIRKWIPGTDTLFYVLRDAGMFLVFLSLYLKRGFRVRTPGWYWAFGVLLFVVAAVQIILDLTTPLLAAIGLRSYVTPLLLLAVVVSRPVQGLARRMSFAVCVVALLNFPVTIAQVLSPRNSLINGQVGSDAAYFVNPGGVVRASGTFSAPAGHTLLMPLALVAGLSLFGSRSVPRWLPVSTIVATLTMTALSGSRAAVVYCSFVAAAYAYSQAVKLSFESLARLILISGVVLGVLYVAFAAFPAVLASFSARVENAGTSEDVGARLFSGISEVATMPFTLFGEGVGAHGITAGRLGVASGEAVESDMGRWLVELGLLGFVLALVRIAAGIILLIAILVNAKSWGVPQTLVGAAMVATLLAGSITQIPTSQGYFAILLSLFYLWRWESKTK